MKVAFFCHVILWFQEVWLSIRAATNFWHSVSQTTVHKSPTHLCSSHSCYHVISHNINSLFIEKWILLLDSLIWTSMVFQLISRFKKNLINVVKTFKRPAFLHLNSWKCIGCFTRMMCSAKMPSHSLLSGVASTLLHSAFGSGTAWPAMCQAFGLDQLVIQPSWPCRHWSWASHLLTRTET